MSGRFNDLVAARNRLQQEINELGGGTGPIAEEITFLPEEAKSQMTLPRDEIEKAASDYLEFKLDD